MYVCTYVRMYVCNPRDRRKTLGYGVQRDKDRGSDKVQRATRYVSAKHKTIFEKGYTPNWTVEVFKIVKVLIP